MDSFLAVLAAAAMACAVAAPALAMPTDDGPPVVAHVRHAAPVTPVGDDGTPALCSCHRLRRGCGARGRRLHGSALGHAPHEPAAS